MVLTDILEQRANLMNKHLRRDFEVHMNLDDYRRLIAEVMMEGTGHILEYGASHNRIFGMEIVIDDSETPCVKVAE